MLVRLVAILVLFLGLAMWAIGDGPEKDRIALAQERVEEQRDTSFDISRTAPEVQELTVEPEKIETLAAVEEPAPVPVKIEQPAATVETASLDVVPEEPAATSIEEALEIAVSEPESEVIELYVTGGRVNLRAGPSTSDSVIGKVTRGQKVELVDFVEDGWAKIRVEGLEQVAFMSGDFLADSP